MRLAAGVISSIKTAVNGLAPFTQPATLMNLVKLFTNDFNPGPNNVAADYTEATFIGYSNATLVASSTTLPFVDPLTGELRFNVPNTESAMIFSCGTTPLAPVTVFGYYVTDSTGATVLAFERFTTPQVISAAGQAIHVAKMELRIPGDLAQVGP